MNVITSAIGSLAMMSSVYAAGHPAFEGSRPSTIEPVVTAMHRDVNEGLYGAYRFATDPDFRREVSMRANGRDPGVRGAPCG